MFIDARPWVKRKPSPDFDWGIVLKESNKVIGMIAVFDIQNARMGDIVQRIRSSQPSCGSLIVSGCDLKHLKRMLQVCWEIVIRMFGYLCS